jgi:hypothetical protein
VALLPPLCTWMLTRLWPPVPCALQQVVRVRLAKAEQDALKRQQNWDLRFQDALAKWRSYVPSPNSIVAPPRYDGRMQRSASTHTQRPC